MAIKSSNVAARVEPEIKDRAEAILASLGISASAGINMFYRQIILWNGLPFRPSIPSDRPLSPNEMTTEELDAKLARGLAHAPSEKPVDTKMKTAVLELAGLWKRHENELSVEETVRDMRKGRSFDT